MKKKNEVIVICIIVLAVGITNFFISKMDSATNKEKLDLCFNAVRSNFLKKATPLCSQNESVPNCVSRDLFDFYLKEHTNDRIACQEIYDPYFKEKKKNIDSCLENAQKIYDQENNITVSRECDKGVCNEVSPYKEFVEMVKFEDLQNFCFEFISQPEL